MKYLLSFLFLACSLGMLRAQTPADTTLCADRPGTAVNATPFKGRFFCKETGINLYLDLYEESLSVPGFGFLGKMNGYMNGNIYGTWMLVSFKIDGPTALLRFSNDIGSDSQDIEFTQVSDSLFTYHAKGGNAIRRAVGRTLVKVTGDMQFVKR